MPIGFYLISKGVISIILTIKIIVGIADNWSSLYPSFIENLFLIACTFADLSIIEMFLISVEYYYLFSFSAINVENSKVTIR